MSQTPDNPGHQPNVFIDVFDTDLLTVVYPEWPALSKREKYRLLRSHRAQIDGHADRRTANVTCVELHKWLAQAINPETNIEDSIAAMALGDGGTTTASGDTALNNELAQLDITDTEYQASNAESHFNLFVDSTELNGNTLNELGLVSDADRFCNHAAIDPAVDKTASKTLIIEVILTFA